MRPQSLLRDLARRLGGAVVLACALAVAGAGAAAKEPRRIVKDPHYGDSLFYFYQDRYFSAVTTLMVSQHFERMPVHADEAEVLRGGLFLSYGLHREAGEIFAQLIERNAPPHVRDRAWFYLAKIRYQRGLFAEAEDAVGRIEASLAPDLQEERLLLQAHLMMARGDYAGAAKVLDTKIGKAGPGQYARFNLGVALIKSGDVARGTALLDELGKTPATTEEYRSLRDKANLALGFSALQGEQPAQAKAYLERVRLNGMLANKALLGFGWAAAGLKNPQTALVPWTELAGRTPADAAVLEAKLAVPYAFAELGAFRQALDGYQQAITVFGTEDRYLDESIEAIRAGKLLQGLLERNPGEEMGWFWNIDSLPEMPHAGHLAPVLAQHDFQEAFKNYRDLHFLARNLQQWEQKLAVLHDMLDNRRRAFAQRLPQVSAKQRALDIAALERRRDELAGELARAEQLGDGWAFADTLEQEFATRLERARETLEKRRDDPELEQARERFRRASGALTWRLADALPERLWESKKAMKDIDAELAEVRGRDAALTQAQTDEPARFDAFAARIAELDRRVRAMRPRVTALIGEQQSHVQELAVAELQRQKVRLAGYTTQAHFAVAQIYDRANLAQDTNRANRP
jgi:hypothetical protein